MHSPHPQDTDRWADLGQLTAFLAHEINNALAPALGYLDLAQGRPPGDPLRDKALDRVDHAVRRIAHLSHSVLGLSNPRPPQESFAPIDSAVATAAGLLPNGHNLIFDIDLQQDTAAIEPIWLEQVLLNLLVNADRALRSAAEINRTIQITGRTQGPIYTLRVQDHGPGVPEHIRQQLFQPGVTAHAPGSTPGHTPGHGLGLALCQRLLEAAGGSIALDPHHTPGAAFVLTLPRAAAIRQAA
ncbi:MAG: HAMP domain-containing sensor histidine kinase [Planctomycetota bacterium]